MNYLIAAIVLFIFSVFIFFGILFILFKNRECDAKQNELKKEWNDLALYDFEKINAPIEHISFLNDEFEKIMYLFNDFGESHKEKLNEIRERIYKLPKTLENYDWKSFKQIYESTQSEIAILKSSLSSLFSIHKNILEYKDYMSYILVAYRENSWNLINFYSTNLIDKQTDHSSIERIKNNIAQLRLDSENLNKCIENFDINTTLLSITNINKSFCNLWEIVNQMYITKKQNNYINYSINEISNILKNNYKNIKQSVINDAEKKISKAIKNNEYVKNHYQKLSEKELQKIIVQIIKSLWKVKKDLNITFKTSEFFNKNKQAIEDSFSMGQRYIPELCKIFKKIYDNFIEDQEIKTRLLECNSKFVSVVKNIEKYNKETEKNNYDPSQQLEKARIIIESLVQNISEADLITSDIISKYNTSKKILNDITSNKLLLTQMKAFMIKNKIKSDNDFELIKKWNNELNDVEKMFFVEKSNNHEYCVTLLAESKSDIWILKERLLKVHKLKLYVERLVNYASLKMALEDNIKYDFRKTFEYYYDGKYKESALSIIQQLKR